MILADDSSLSADDKAALRHVLGLANELAGELASYAGLPVPTVMRKARNKVMRNTPPLTRC